MYSVLRGLRLLEKNLFSWKILLMTALVCLFLPLLFFRRILRIINRFCVIVPDFELSVPCMMVSEYRIVDSVAKINTVKNNIDWISRYPFIIDL